MKIKLLLFFCLMSFFSFSQSMKKINDPSIVAQEKRQVFERWGDWKPEAKTKLLGIDFGVNMNPQYTVVWGWAAPSRNKKYKKGKDIRPLSVGGEETIRQVKASIMKQQAEHIKKSMDSILERNKADMAHWTSLYTNADPLFLLYYKRILDPLKKFPDNPTNYIEWGFKNEKIFESAQNTGGIKFLKEELDLLKDTYKKSMNVDMPRGKRYLMFHKVLLGWRKFLKNINFHNEANNDFLIYKNKQKKLNDKTYINQDIIGKSDKEIAEKIIEKYKAQF